MSKNVVLNVNVGKHFTSYPNCGRGGGAVFPQDTFPQKHSKMRCVWLSVMLLFFVHSVFLDLHLIARKFVKDVDYLDQWLPSIVHQGYVCFPLKLKTGRVGEKQASCGIGPSIFSIFCIFGFSSLSQNACVHICLSPFMFVFILV